MDGQLTQVRTYKQPDSDLNQYSKPSSKTSSLSPSITTANEALEVLQNQPDYQNLVSALKFISQRNASLYISSPSPISARLVHVLVSEIVPSFWGIFSEAGDQSSLRSNPEFKLLTSCLQNVTSLNLIILRLKIYIQQSKASTDLITQGPSIQEYLRIYLDLLKVLLSDNTLIIKIWKEYFENPINSTVLTSLWKEILATFGSGKIIGTSAEAEDVLCNLFKNFNHKYWFADGRQYSLWLARNIVYWAENVPTHSNTDIKHCADLMSKSISLGYPDAVIKEMITDLLLTKHGYCGTVSKICANLSSSEQRKMVHSLLKLSATYYLSGEVTVVESRWWKKDALSISAVAALISIIISESDVIKSHLLAWLSSNFGAGIGEGVSIRRSVLAALAKDTCCMENIFEKCLEQFGDHLYIRHAPTLQQEVCCQILLLTAGYVHRQSPLRLRMIFKSGSNLSLVSNRLAAPSNRARFLGMVVGEALSAIVDKVDSRMKFKVEEMENTEAKWYKSLVEVEDSVGSLEYLRSKVTVKNINQVATPGSKKLAKPTATRLLGVKNLLIEEVKTGKEEPECDNLNSYLKPDSDPEDSDDDPTLIKRNKLVLPVYIRDLITYLRNFESYDHQRLGLSTAASLIRRKANFGTEVSEHAEELATLLVGIQDKYEIENFSNLLLGGIIALLVALPSKMGQWFSNTFFEGDYSISQRSSILTALSLSAREIGGLGIHNDINSSNQSIEASFPSKVLPESLGKYYTPQVSTQVDALSARLERNMITPMASSLADKLTGPTILKIRTFSSRLEVEKRRPKPTINKLSKIVGESFFFPLIRRFFIHSHSYAISKQSVIFQPFLLSHFIKTLAIIIHAAGPSTPLLPNMTVEFWDLLLGLQVIVINERIVYEAACFALLTLLELNLDKSELVQLHGRRLLETQRWVSDIIGGLGNGDEDERCKMLAAGCMVRIQEIIEKYQRLLLATK